jgi:hypothetical protein
MTGQHRNSIVRTCAWIAQLLEAKKEVLALNCGNQAAASCQIARRINHWGWSYGFE